MVIHGEDIKKLVVHPHHIELQIHMRETVVVKKFGEKIILPHGVKSILAILPKENCELKEMKIFEGEELIGHYKTWLFTSKVDLIPDAIMLLDIETSEMREVK